MAPKIVPNKNNCASTWFLLFTLFVFFMFLYVFASMPVMTYVVYTPVEKYQDKDLDSLIPVDKLMVVQGNGVPDTKPQTIQLDTTDPSTMGVDGTDQTPKSMFMFAYNKCDAACCGESPYSCNGGCVCLTKEQKKYMSSRGFNNKYNKCSMDEY